MVRQLPTRLDASAMIVVVCLLVAACGAGGREAPEDAVADGGQNVAGVEQEAVSVPQARAEPSTTGAGAGTTTQPDPETTTTVPESTTTTTEATPETSTSSTVQEATSSSSAQDVVIPPIEVGVPQGAEVRIPTGQTWAPFASFEAVTLHHPSDRVERIGFHESNHDGARQLAPTSTAIAPIVMDSRDRDTGSRTAADIVVEPGTEIRAPVTGTVIRAGGYVLYCDHQDDFAVIEPDAHPGWEVKILHIDGVMVSAGDRVEAGVTVIAPAATILPFDSQVDEFTATPAWPHVHIELVDPSIPDRPSTGGGC